MGLINSGSGSDFRPFNEIMIDRPTERRTDRLIGKTHFLLRTPFEEAYKEMYATLTLVVLLPR